MFHPSHEHAVEDDGVLMGYPYDQADDKNNLVLLDASTLNTVARIHQPTRVPNGFHGNWIQPARPAPRS